MGRDEQTFTDPLELPRRALAELCTGHRIRSMAAFGSRSRGDHRPDSDLDLLVEVEPGHTPGLFTLAAMELELEQLLGIPVELRTLGDLSPLFRDQVRRAAVPVYDAGP